MEIVTSSDVSITIVHLEEDIVFVSCFNKYFGFQGIECFVRLGVICSLRKLSEI